MAEFTVTDPQTGRQVTLIGDSAPTEAELLEIFGPTEETPIRDRIAATDAAGLVYGATRPVTAAFQIGAEAGDFLAERLGLDPVMGEQITSGLREFQRSRQRGRENRFVENPELAEQLNLQRGPGASPDLLPMAAEMGTGGAILSRMKPATGWIARTLQGLGAGAGLSLLQPVTEDENFASQKASQGFVGGLMGAAVPLTASGIGGAWRRLTRRGQERAAAEAAVEAAGDRTDEIIDVLETGDDILGPQTAGQRASQAGSAEFSALQRQAGQMRPTQYSERARQQNAARINEIRQLGGTPEALKTKIDEAEREIGALYNRAFAEPLGTTSSLTQALDDPFVKDAIRDAKKIATSEGVEEGTTRYFHLIKKALDDIVSKPAVEGGLGPTQRRAATGARDRFLAALDEANPAYAVARQEAAEIYRPITQMRVGQYLEEKMIPALNDAGADNAQRGQVLANALRDIPNVIKRATGFRGTQELDQILEPAQLEMVSNVVDDLGKLAQYESLAKAGNQRSNQLLNEIFNEQAPNALSRPLMILNAILRRTGNRASERTLGILAEKMLDPAEMAKIMRQATSQEAAQLERAVLIALSQGVGDYGGAGFNEIVETIQGTQ